jgi:carboxyl-terminal processing protease
LAFVIILAFILGFQSSGILRILERKEKLPEWASRIAATLTSDLQAMPVGFSGDDLRIFEDVLSYISVNYLYQDKINRDDIIHGAAAGAVQSLGDRYSRFVPPPDQQQLTEEIQGEYAGIGVRIIDRPGVLPPMALQCEIEAGADPESPEFMREFRSTVIVGVFENGPAAEVGLKQDDVIVCVDGSTLRGHPADDAVALIKGTPGSFVNITVWRPATQEELTFDVERRVVQIESVSDVEMLDDNIGYIRLEEFNNHSTEEMRAAVDQLSEQDMKGLILDLRNNTGGTVEAAVGVADIFIPDGIMVYYRDNRGDQTGFPADGEGDGGYSLGVPLVLLTNGSTASASEILAGAVRDSGVGLLVGETTFGKGVVQNVYALPDGSGLVLTTGVYLTPAEHEITEDGLQPDILSDLNPDRLRQEDPRIDAFLKHMDDLNQEYLTLRQDMSDYLSSHDFQRDTGLEVINEWIGTGVKPASEAEANASTENEASDSQE